MGDQDDRRPKLVPDLAQKLHDLRLHRHVECGRRLIRDQQLGAAQKRHRDHDPLPHPAGKLMRIHADTGSRLGDADGVEHPHGFGLSLAFRQTLVQPQHFGHLVRDPHVGIERGHRVLKDHRDLVGPDPVQVLLAQPVDPRAFKGDFAGGPAVPRQQAHDGKNRLRFPRPGLTHNRQHLAWSDIETHAIDRVHDAVACLERNG